MDNKLLNDQNNDDIVSNDHDEIPPEKNRNMLIEGNGNLIDSSKVDNIDQGNVSNRKSSDDTWNAICRSTKDELIQIETEKPESDPIKSSNDSGKCLVDNSTPTNSQSTNTLTSSECFTSCEE